MTEKYTNNELKIMFENICEKIDEGFKGVHERQDKTNGNVIKNTEFRLKTIGSLMTLKFLVGVLGIGNIVLIIKTFFIK